MKGTWNRILGRKEGQSLTEFALVLPLLVILLLGMIEIGVAFYDYMVVVSANREGVRIGSRGRYLDPAIVGRIIATGGSTQLSNGTIQTNLRTGGSDPNLGVIIHHITLDATSGQVVSVSHAISGSIIGTGGTMRPILESDSRLTATDWANYVSQNGSYTSQINEYRKVNGYDGDVKESLIVIETFMAHRSMTGLLKMLIPDPLQLYFLSTMRVMQDSRVN